MSTLPLIRVPSGTTRLTIFDTNAYRELTFGLSLEDARAEAVAIRQMESRQGVLALASPIVIWELASHLADTTDPAYAHCQNALVALAEHTRSSDAHNPGICMALDSEWVVCDALFQKTPQGAEQNSSNLAKLANHVRDRAPNLTDPAVLANLQVFAREMARRESTWLADLQQLLQGLDPAAATTTGTPAHNDKAARKRLHKSLKSAAFGQLWATAAVIHHAGLVGIVLDSSELAGRVKFFREHFSVPFHLMVTLIQNVLGQSHVDLFSPKKKRGNFMWDAGISYVIPSAAATDGTTTQVVTADKAILAAAKSAGCAQAIVSIEDYCTVIGAVRALPRR